MSIASTLFTPRKLAVFAALAVILLVAPKKCTYVPFEMAKANSYATDVQVDGPLHAAAATLTTEFDGKSLFYPLVEGNDALGARLKMIASANSTIDMQYFLLKPDAAGSVIVAALIQAAARGVRVRLLLDDIFTTASDDQLGHLDSFDNIELRLFNPLSRKSGKILNFVWDMQRVNRRMHNKSMTVDNSISIFGGRNIADEYFQINTNAEFADFDMISIGPVVQQIFNEFDLFWNDAATVPVRFIVGDLTEDRLRTAGKTITSGSRDALEGVYRNAVDSTFLADVISGKIAPIPATANLVTDSPDKIRTPVSKGANLRILSDYMNRQITGSKSDVLIVTPYFVPERPEIEMYTNLSKGGVRVRILTNSLASTNHSYVHGGYAPWRKELLEAGVELYEIRADAPVVLGHAPAETAEKLTMHTKAAVFDKTTAFIGSMNFDPRSIEINTEVGVFITQSDFAATFVRSIDSKLADYTFKVSLDEQGKLMWTYSGGEKPEIFTSDPLAKPLDRIIAKIASLLPIKGQM